MTVQPGLHEGNAFVFLLLLILLRVTFLVHGYVDLIGSGSVLVILRRRLRTVVGLIIGVIINTLGMTVRPGLYEGHAFVFLLLLVLLRVTFLVHSYVDLVGCGSVLVILCRRLRTVV